MSQIVEVNWLTVGDIAEGLEDGLADRIGDGVHRTIRKDHVESARVRRTEQSAAMELRIADVVRGRADACD